MFFAKALSSLRSRPRRRGPLSIAGQRSIFIWPFGFWICVFWAGWAVLSGVADTTNRAHRTFVPTAQYLGTNVAGWTVQVNRELLTTREELGRQALELLRAHLQGITNAVPARACRELQRVPVWLGVDDGHAPCAEYHPSRDWLTENGYNPDKARAVEIGNARRFIDWSPSQPMMVLHELAHAYHDRVLGFDNPRVRAAFRRARASGRYDHVARNNGATERAYAVTDDHEYFAELSEAYFGTNDFFPFTREELKRHDPDAYELLKELWK